MDQTGGAKKRSKAKPKPKAKSKPKVKKVVRKQKGGAFTPDQEQAIYNAYLQSGNPNAYLQSGNPNKNKITNSTYNQFIKSLLTGLGYSDLINDVNEAKLIIDTKIIEADIQSFSGNNNNSVRGKPPNTRRSTNIMSAKQKLQAAQQKLAEFRTGALTEIDSGSLSSTLFNKTNNNKQSAAVVASNAGLFNEVVNQSTGLEVVNQSTGLSGGKKSKKTVKKPTAKKAPKKAPKKK
jgi:hypothetical protein